MEREKKWKEKGNLISECGKSSFLPQTNFKMVKNKTFTMKF